jgi:hypothetical protein
LSKVLRRVEESSLRRSPDPMHQASADLARRGLLDPLHGFLQESRFPIALERLAQGAQDVQFGGGERHGSSLETADTRLVVWRSVPHEAVPLPTRCEHL